ncbi:dephospho-CoA kinase [Candidatus Aerophobetes bacterium]|uniref:Dephospho-CoA kinase n=1 Tax=Aerophobetes bacterium TaxID=2030807 RepID=A0A2A4X0L6_UNCAE|nr:MAG: dephospho-CoA kinase [Candidatus Aerophobetes bacterium]
MLILKKIAVTGGMYSGKTTACKFLESLGAYLLYSDNVVHHILNYNTQCQAKLRHLLGSEIIVDGKCDRPKVADIIFSNYDLLEATEKIIHPLLLEEITKQYEILKQSNKYSCFCVEMPLVQEIGFSSYFDTVVAISSNEESITERMSHGTKSQKEFEKRQKDYRRRMHRQYSGAEKAQSAEININNNGSIEELKTELLELWPHLITPS